MRFILFTGSHPRHIFIHRNIIQNFEIAGIVCMKRENLSPFPPDNIDLHDKELFIRHFQRRTEVEQAAYGDLSTDYYKDIAPTLFIDSNQLNTNVVLDFVKKNNPDACFIFGTDLICDPVLSVLPYWKVNLHLGYSPWYKGSATLFWPFYFLQPQFAGATIHQIVPQADAGDIIHHVFPKLSRGMGIHDVAAAVVKQASLDIVKVFSLLVDKHKLPTVEQKTVGRLFLTKDFEPHHLRPIYDLFKDKIVDNYIDGYLGKRQPRKINCFSKIEPDRAGCTNLTCGSVIEPPMNSKR